MVSIREGMLGGIKWEGIPEGKEREVIPEGIKREGMPEGIEWEGIPEGSEREERPTDYGETHQQTQPDLHDVESRNQNRETLLGSECCQYCAKIVLLRLNSRET